MSLDITLFVVRRVEAHECNITHNLVQMADVAGLYGVLWQPERNGIKYAADMIVPLRNGLEYMKKNRAELEKLTPHNGWGSYDGLLGTVEKLLAACMKNPDAEVEASR